MTSVKCIVESIAVMKWWFSKRMNNNFKHVLHLTSPKQMLLIIILSELILKSGVKLTGS